MSFKKRYNIDPKIVVLTFSEIIDKTETLTEEKRILLRVEIAVNYFMGKTDIEWFGKFTGGTSFENVNIFLNQYDKEKFRDELFFYIDTEKVILEVGYSGNVTSREWEYSYQNKYFNLIETFAIEDIYKN